MTHHIRGVLWFVLSLFISSANDVLTKYLGSTLQASQIVFLRFAFSTITLLPFMFINLSLFRTSRLNIHAIRGALLYGGILFWCLGLNVVKVTLATVITFTIPIFVLVLAAIFLKEKLSLPKMIAAICGFIGIIVVMNPGDLTVNLYSGLLTGAALMFALLDIINKKFVSNEPMLGMLFYSSLFTTIFAVAGAANIWIKPSSIDLLLCLFLGVGANLILYCLLKAFAIIEVSRVAPYRYLELLFSSILGFVVFQELPDRLTIIGAIIIVGALSAMELLDNKSKLAK